MTGTQTTLPLRTALDAWYESDAGRRFIEQFRVRTLALVANKQRVNAKGIIEDMRRNGWKMCVGAHGLGINNTNVTPFARRFVQQYPELAEHFEFRGRP